jgi:hypothetical protein
MSDASQGVYDDYKRKQTRKYFDCSFNGGTDSVTMLTEENFKMDEESSPELRKVLECIKADLEKGIKMNFHVFYNKFDIAMDKLTVTERALLLRRAPRRRTVVHSSKPVISTKSIQLAQRRASTGTIFERLTIKAGDEWLKK